MKHSQMSYRIVPVVFVALAMGLFSNQALAGHRIGCFRLTGNYTQYETRDCQIYVEDYHKKNLSSIGSQPVYWSLRPEYYDRNYEQWVYGCFVCVGP